MHLLEKIARQIAPTRFGRWALDTSVNLNTFKARADFRVYTGIVMIVMSFIVGIPGVVLCGFLAGKYQQPMILIFGGSAAMVFNYSLFGAGIYLAGGNYAVFLFRWCVRRFIERFGNVQN